MKTKKQELVSILKELCHVETWEGVNRNTAKFVFYAYADRIIKLLEENGNTSSNKRS